MRNRAFAVFLSLLVVGLAACGNDDKPDPTTTTTEGSTTTTSAAPVGPPPAVKVTTVATLDRPMALSQRDGDNALYVAERGGTVRAIRDGVVDPGFVLDISSDVSAEGERGLLGMAFAPGKPQFYVNYTDKDGDTHITEFTLGADNRVDMRSKRELLFIKQPYPNHNGGSVAFGPDGHLYLGMGDGGSAGDPHKNGQNLTVLLGKILRINPQPSGDLPYTIPFDNPFVKQQGARGEIWAYGLRNPWRFSFDKADRGIWIGDVGQNRVEEIDHLPYDPKGGTNYGWSLREGTLKQDGAKPNNAVDPVYEYSLSGGPCSVVGGYVYRGTNVTGLAGRFLFSDFCTGQIATLTQRGTAYERDDLNVKVESIASFGQDRNGEIYTLSLSGQVGRIDLP